MLTKLNELIAKGGFTGMNVAVRSLSGTELSVIVTAQATPLKGDSHIKEDTTLDTYYALRQALVTPQVFSGTPEQIDVQVTEFVDTIGDSVQNASEQLSVIGKAAKLDAATSQAKEATKKVEKKADKKADKKTESKTANSSSKSEQKADKADAKPDSKAEQNTPQNESGNSGETEQPPKSEPVPESKTSGMFDFDDVDSI